MTYFTDQYNLFYFTIQVIFVYRYNHAGIL